MLIIYSCQKDDSFIESENTTVSKEPNGVSSQILTLDDLNQKQSLNKPLLKMKGLLDVDKVSGEYARLTTTDSTFTVFTDQIVELTTSNSVSYSFLTEFPINPYADFENLVLFQREGEHFKFYLYSYKTIFYNEQWSNYIISRTLLDGETLGLEALIGGLASRTFWSGDCLWDVSTSGNDIVITLIFCFGASSGSGMNGGVGGVLFNSNNAIPSPNDNCGNWYLAGVPNGGKCIWTQICTDSSGTGYHYSMSGPCNGGDNGDNNGNNGNTGDNGGLGDGEPGDGPIDGGSGGAGNPPNGEDGETIGVNPPREPRDFAQEVVDCFSNAGILFNISALSIKQQKVLAYYLQKDSNNSSGTNCSDPQALAFAHEAALAMREGGDVDFENEIILDPSFCDNEILDCVYDTILSDPNSFTNAILNNFLSEKTAKLKFEVGNIPTQLDGTIAFTYTNLDPDSTIANGDVMTVRISSEFLENASALEIALVLMHEPIHAELLDRCIQLDIITHVNTLGHVKFSGSSNSVTLQDMIFNMMIQEYRNYNGGNSGQWNHDAFTTLGYRDNMIQDLIDIHPLLNNSSDDFLTNVNSDPNIVGGPYTIPQIMDYYSWVGLEETQDYINNVANDSVELSKKQYIEDVVNTMYNQDCN